MSVKLQRRTFLKGSVAATAAVAAPLPAMAQDVLKMGVVLPSPAADVGWSHTLLEGINTAKEAYGDKLEVTVLENIAEGPDADRIANGLVAEGNSVLMLGSFGYQNGGIQIAKRRRDVSIIRVRLHGRAKFCALHRKILAGHISDGDGSRVIDQVQKAWLCGRIRNPRADHFDQLFHVGRTFG